MDAIVLAGGVPQPDDPLYAYSKGNSKALIDVAGKPMVQWVLDALGDAKHVDKVIVIGLSPKSDITCKKPMHFISNQGRMLANIVAGVNKSIELDKKSKYVLVVSADVPALKSEMVDWLVETAMQTKDDLYYGVCPRDVMEARYPESKRTYTKLKDIELCGADVNVTHVRMATEHLDTWETLIGNRKSPLRQARTIGLGTLWQVLTHSVTLDDLVTKVCEKIGIKGRVIIWSHAEACMDVDKPHQLELLRADLAKKQQKTTAKTKKTTVNSAKKSATAKVVKTTKAKITAKAPKATKTTPKANPKKK